ARLTPAGESIAPGSGTYREDAPGGFQPLKPLASVTIPHETVNDDAVTLIEWLVTNGERVNEGQPIASVETSKAVMRIEAPATGFLEALFQPGDEIGVGETLCHLHESPPNEPVNNRTQVAKGSLPSSIGWVTDPNLSVSSGNSGGMLSPSPANTSPLNVGRADQNPRENSGSTRFSKQAANLLKQHDLDSSLFAGRGLVSSSDILAYLRQMKIPVSPPVTDAAKLER